MSGGVADGIGAQLTTAEAKIIVAALRQFEPYWPADMDDMSRAELLAEIRLAIDRVAGLLQPGVAPNS
jgi:hypothetical protein